MKNLIIFSAIMMIASIAMSQTDITLMPKDSTGTSVDASLSLKLAPDGNALTAELDFSKYGKPVVLKKKQFLHKGKPADTGVKPNALVDALFAIDGVKHVIYLGGTSFSLDMKSAIDKTEAGKLKPLIIEAFEKNFLAATIVAKDGSISK